MYGCKQIFKKLVVCPNDTDSEGHRLCPKDAFALAVIFWIESIDHWQTRAMPLAPLAFHGKDIKNMKSNLVIINKQSNLPRDISVFSPVMSYTLEGFPAFPSVWHTWGRWDGPVPASWCPSMTCLPERTSGTLVSVAWDKKQTNIQALPYIWMVWKTEY